MMRASSLSNGRFIMALVHAIPVVMAISFAIIFIKFGEVRASTKQTSDVLQSFSNEGPAMVLICLPYIYYSLELYGRKYVNLLSLLSAFFVIYMSQSRGAIFMSIIMVPLLIYFYPSSIFVRSKKFIKTMFVIIVIGLISFCIFDIEKIFKPVLTRFTNSQLMNLNGFISPNSSMPDYGRSLIYFEGIKAICEKPILGIGYGSLLPYMDQKLGVGLGSVSHNIIITSWGEMGLPGVFVLLWLVISLINGLSRKKIKKIYLKKDRFIASATACSLIIAFIHAQFRPFYSNPMIPIVLAQAYIYILNYKVFISGKFIYNRKDNLITN
jgi:O-antigen ligase